MYKGKTDYSIYLVTDSGGRKPDAFCDIVEQALQGGASLVQLREKTASTRDFYELALRLKTLTERYRVPLIINDRLDIAMAVDAAGLHVGEEDLPVAVARKLLGPDKILGATAASVKAALAAEADGADYIGSGAVFATGTKPGKAILPLSILTLIKQAVRIPVVAIGGINGENIGPVRRCGVDGVAVVSAIMDSAAPRQATRELRTLWLGPV